MQNGKISRVVILYVENDQLKNYKFTFSHFIVSGILPSMDLGSDNL